MKDELNQALSQPTQDGSSADNSVKQDPSDKLTPDHPRFKDVYNDLKVEREARLALEEKIKELETKVAPTPEEDEDELTDEQRSAIDKIKKTLLKEGVFATRDEIDRNIAVEKRAITHDRLGLKYSGDNGYPKYNAIEVTEYAKKNGMGDNYEAAYKAMHLDAIVQVEAKRLGAKENQVVESERPTGVRIEGAGVSTNQVGKMSDAEYEQKRIDILTAMKNSAKRATVNQY